MGNEQQDFSTLSYKELSDLIGLPMKIYATLEHVSMSPEGHIVIYLDKKNKFKLAEYVQKLKVMEGRELFLHVDEGYWDKPLES